MSTKLLTRTYFDIITFHYDTKIFYIFILLSIVLGWIYRNELSSTASPLLTRVKAKATLENKQKQYGETARKSWKPFFSETGVSYPPDSFTLLGLKQDWLLEVYAPDKNGENRFIRSIPICARSRVTGPKLREGDKYQREYIEYHS